MKHKNYFDLIVYKLNKYDRKNLIFVFFIIFCSFLVIELFSYTVINFNFYQSLADKQQIWEVVVPVTRWTIYFKWDNPTIIWTSLNLYDIAVDPKNEWDKLKLTNFLTEIVYKELCYSKSNNDCYENTLDFLHIIEIENFVNDQVYIKKLIFDKLKSRIYQEKVTSVLVDKELTEKNINSIKNSWIPGLYITNKKLYINPEEINNSENVVNFLNEAIWIDKDILLELVKKRDLKYVPIINKISISTWEEIKKYLSDELITIKKWLLDEKDSIWNFIILTPMPNRFYPEKKVASQLVWFVDKTWVWNYWIEWYFDDILKWNNWKIVSRKDIQWRIIDPIWLKKEDFVWEGVKIFTTIDRNIQSKVENILEAWVKKYRANKWSIIIMQPKTWEIIAMANYPTFDLNNFSDIYELEKVKFSKYPNPKIDLLWMPVFVEDSKIWTKFYYDSKEIFLREATSDEIWDSVLVKYKYKNDFWPDIYRNDVISSLYEPGSVMKSITVAVWIDTWEINRYDMYMDEWKVEIGQYTLENVAKKCLWYHSFAHALNYSCNVWMVRIVQKIWKVLLYQYLNDFGFSQKTWITLSWEVTSEIRPWGRWSMAQLFTSSYWLWISITPLQMASAYSVLANWGLYMKPRIIDHIEYPNGKIIEYKDEIVRRVIKKSTSDTLTSMLNSSINDWVAKTWNVPGYALAWKTWTAQISSKWVYEEWVWATIWSFVWYWPIQDPEFVIIIKLDRPRLSSYWWETSWYIFKETAEYLLDYLGIPKKVD